MASRSMLWLCGWAASWWKPGGPREAARSRARCQKRDVEVRLVRLTLPSAMNDVLSTCCGGVQLPCWPASGDRPPTATLVRLAASLCFCQADHARRPVVYVVFVPLTSCECT